MNILQCDCLRRHHANGPFINWR